MANKKMDKLKINTTNLMNALHDRGISIRELGRDENFQWSDKSIGRALHDKEASHTLVRDLAKRLDVDIEYLTGEQEVKKIADGLYKHLSLYFSDMEIRVLKLSILNSADALQDEELTLYKDIVITHKHLEDMFKNL